MILSVNNVSKSFGSDEIIRSASFHIEEHEKAAIVGANGVGKSTLLKMIVGELAPDTGEVIPAKGITIGYLAQDQDLSSHRTIYEEMAEVKRPVIRMEERMRELEHSMKNASGRELDDMMSSYSRLSDEFDRINGYAWKSEVIGVLKGLGFSESEFDKQIHMLSGGQKTRVSMGRILLSDPDMILLDEPTNHLDMSSIAWLENYLANYNGAVIVVAHDRYFLDRVVSKVIEIEGGNVRTFSGNYTSYSEKKAQMRSVQMKAYLNQQQEIKHQEEVIEKLRSFNREKSIKRAESREKMLNRIELVEKPSGDDTLMQIRFEPDIVSGNDVLTIRGLSKSFGENHLFSDLDLDIKRGERVLLMGDNGTGKTTLLKIITGLETPDSGEVTAGTNVHIGYYDQDHQVLHMEKTLFEEISDEYPDMTNTEIRNTLAAFLFTGDDVFKRVSDLSGGERGRLSLAKLMLSDSNFLILDEPTNHLDINSREILENALVNYGGTVLCVSHDRYFINRTATRILDLADHHLYNYIGNYDYYLEKRDDVMAAEKSASPVSHSPAVSDASPSSPENEWKTRKEEQARIRKRENDLKKTEDEITSLEERGRSIDQLLCDESVFTDVEKLMELNGEKQEIEDRLGILYEKWEELMEENSV